jgi:hypothetical protein
LDTLEKRIARLEAIEEIKTLIARFARGTDRHNDPAVTRQVFSDDAVWESSQYGRYEGLERIVDATSQGGREIILWSMHYMVSPIIEIDASLESATAQWYLWEPMTARFPDGSVSDTWFGATYEAKLRCVGRGQWKVHYLYLRTRLLAKVGAAWPGDIGEAMVDERQFAAEPDR